MKRGKYATDKPYRESALCFIPSLRLSCFGCCGQDYGSKEAMLRRIERNTREFKQCDDLRVFRDRAQETSACGLCTNVVLNEKRDRVVCPLHPKLNDGKDLREGYCQIDHLCKCAEIFSKWGSDMQQKFMDFISEKVKNGMDWYDYSMGMDDNSLLKEFMLSLQQ